LKRSFFAAMAGLAALVLPGLAAVVPRPAPEFPIRLANGQQVLLSQFRGKVVALEFLHTTCPHCQTCSAIMQKMYKELGAKGFQPLGVAFNDFANALLPDYVSQLGLTFPVGSGGREEVLSFLQQSVAERFYVPQLVFIDRKGVIRAQYPGGDKFFENEEPNMRAQIESLLKESGASAKKSAPGAKSAPAKQPSAASLPRAKALE
jgi:peroxiredoxin